MDRFRPRNILICFFASVLFFPLAAISQESVDDLCGEEFEMLDALEDADIGVSMLNGASCDSMVVKKGEKIPKIKDGYLEKDSQGNIVYETTPAAQETSVCYNIASCPKAGNTCGWQGRRSPVSCNCRGKKGNIWKAGSAAMCLSDIADELIDFFDKDEAELRTSQETELSPATPLPSEQGIQGSAM